ncbi:MAG: ABC transporter ATP-binding protein [Clostridia bacterium]|nr:ABC transporter ATP-binding protein [Clostridia bacterium]NCC76094.1 ABC transporter ATP-binding protein [Clostridia bacterium]
MNGKSFDTNQPAADILLDIRQLETTFFTHVGPVQAVRGIDLVVERGEAVGVVGESGCGKSVMSMSIMGLVANPGKIVGGEIFFNGQDLAKMSDKELRKIRGNKVAMIFQDPMTSLNPVKKIGGQITEVLHLHQNISREDARTRAIELLNLVGIPSPESRLDQYPFEFSGGMRQRVMIAMSLACDPDLLIADEPTTALDVTIQAQILELMRDLRNKINSSIILITHDLGVVANLCDSIRVMYAGKIVEEGKTRDIFYEPRHPYTWGLLNSIPKINVEEKERLIPIDGQPPDLLKPPAGCAFAERCPHAMTICQQQQPPLIKAGEGHEHRAACWLNHAQAEAVAAPLFAAQTQQDKLEGQA